MSDNELMKLAKKRVYSKRAFYMHLAVCTAITIMLMTIYFVTSFGEGFWPIWPIIGLFIGIVIHAVSFFSIFNSDDKIREEYHRLKQKYNSENLQ